MKDQHWVTCYYFTEAIIKKMVERSYTAGDNYGVGEDTLVDDLRPFGEVLAEIGDRECVIKNFPGVFDYEISNELAADLWWELCPEEGDEHDGMFSLPDLQTWRGAAETLVARWVADGNLQYAKDCAKL